MSLSCAMAPRLPTPCVHAPTAVLLQLVDELQVPGEGGAPWGQPGRGTLAGPASDPTLVTRDSTWTPVESRMQEEGGLSKCLLSMLDAERVRDSERKSAQRQEREKERVREMEMEQEKARIRSAFPETSTASSRPCSCAPCFLNKLNSKHVQALPCKSHVTL